MRVPLFLSVVVAGGVLYYGLSFSKGWRMMGERAFRISWQGVGNPLVRLFLRVSHGLWERLLGLRALERRYRQLRAVESEEHFAARILSALKVRTVCGAEDVERIPEVGPLAVIANHPFGAMEGLALLELIRRKRKDVKVLANYILHRIPELREEMFFVDPFGRADSAARNVQSLRHALQWLREGKALILFPAGEVASFAPKAFRVRDAQWHTSIMTLIRRVEREVKLLPIFIPGRASLFFHFVGKIHPRLRTLLLPREMLRCQNRPLTLHVGSVLSSEELFRRFDSDEDALRYLRFRTFLLEGREVTSAFEERMRRLTLDEAEREEVPIIAPVQVEAIEAELRTLPPEACLCSTEEYDIYAAQGKEIPETLKEIGRLRELSFRAIGEGTGRDVDNDEFDAVYYQIVLWHRERREIVGCYRLALSDVVVEEAGLSALYTRTLFRFDERFLGYLPGPAVELGRSFVRPSDQRTFAPLLLLWRGVLTFLARHPRYTVLFGPVSISHDFRPAARDLLLSYLRQHCYDPLLAQLVSARLPPKPLRFVEWRHPDYEDFLQTEADTHVALAEIEEGRREMPVLIRQYRKLGGKIVAFNVDPEFGTVVDGLIVVDLLKAPPRDIARYMGKELYERYISAPRED